MAYVLSFDGRLLPMLNFPLLYITQTAQPVIVQSQVVDPIRILVEPV